MNKYNLKINDKKTKIMASGRKLVEWITIKIGQQDLIEEGEFCYPGSQQRK
jgi:hypothetical protein